MAHTLQHTPARRRALEILPDGHRALGACDILVRSGEEGPGAQPPAAYRALDVLTTIFPHDGRLRASDPAPERPGACACPKGSHTRAFMIRRSRSAVAETPATPAAEALGEAVRAAGFSIEHAVFEVEGMYSPCDGMAAASSLPHCSSTRAETPLSGWDWIAREMQKQLKCHQSLPDKRHGPRSTLAMKTIIASLTLATLAGAASAQETRELGAHEHGHSALDIAFDGKQVSMALKAPGDDIVGFEYPATSVEDRAAIDTAVAALSEPLSIFVLPAAAGCSVTEATASLVTGHHEEEEEGDAHAVEDEDHDDETGPPSSRRATC